MQPPRPTEDEWVEMTLQEKVEYVNLYVADMPDNNLRANYNSLIMDRYILPEWYYDLWWGPIKATMKARGYID